MSALQRIRGWPAELVVVAAMALALGLASVVSLTIWPLVAGLLAYLGWHLAQAWRFLLGARSGDFDRYSAPGIWGDIWRSAQQLESAEHKIRKKLERFDTRFRDAAAAYPDALVALSRSHKVRWCNQMAAELLMNSNLDQLAGRQLRELINHSALHQYLDAGQFEDELVMAAPNDRTRVVSIRVLPFGRKKHQLLLTGSDITRTYHLDAARRDFVANVSHELRTPLTVIAGYLDPLADHLQDDREWTHSLELMQQQAARMRQMIDDLTLLSRLESEEKPRHDETVDVSALITEVTAESRALAFAAGHEIDVDAQHDIGVRGDRGELRSVVSNLMINSLRHTPAGTHVRVSWRRDGDGATLAVRDDGPGIDACHLPRLTERFYRVDPGRSRRSGGTGLGLAIVKHVLTRHEGQLSIDSDAGRGSAFRCHFPQARLVTLSTAPTKHGS